MGTPAVRTWGVITMCFDIGIVTCGPNEALVISGMCQGGVSNFITGGRAIVFPCIQTVQRIPLNTMTLEVHTSNVYTSQGVPISVVGTAQVKINGSSDEMLSYAAEQFGGKSQDEILQICLETVEGHQRAIMGNMSGEEIYRDRKTFSKNVFNVASVDLHNMGIAVISYTLKDVRDDVGYLASLGQARTAQVKRDAPIAEALAEEQRMESKLLNDTEIARSKRDFELKKASYDTEVNTAKAEAEMAYGLQAAKVQAKIKEEEMQVKVVERAQNISIQDQEIKRKEKELDSKVRKPAEAEKYRLEKIAEAERQKVVLEAEAEAEQMAKKADAWKEYKEAALVDMMLKVLPKVAAEVAGPISETNKITMVSTGDGPIGASRVTNEVLDIMGSLPDTVKKMTGVDITTRMAQA